MSENSNIKKCNGNPCNETINGIVYCDGVPCVDALGRNRDWRGGATAAQRIGVLDARQANQQSEVESARLLAERDQQRRLLGLLEPKQAAEYLAEIESANGNPSDSSLFHTENPTPQPIFIPAPNTKKVGQSNAQITFGSDRPTGLASGFGATGFVSNTIDLVVGRAAKSDHGAGVKPGTLVHNNFFSDAARIYISEKTLIDHNFALAGHDADPESTGLSGIGIKADTVRLIGVKGVKIISGRARVAGFGATGETDIDGGAVPAAPPIELIAGNNTDSKSVWGGMFHPTEVVPGLQPLVKGKNMVDSMSELHQIIGEIWSALFNLTLLQTTYNGVLGVTPIPWHAAAAPAITQGNMSHVMSSLYHTRVKARLWKVDYLRTWGYKYICSTNVRAN